MNYFKIPLTVLLFLVLAIEGSEAYRILVHGWPNHVEATGSDNAMIIKVTPIPFTVTDWLILAGLFLLNVLLVYVVWRLWKSPSQQHTRH